MRLAGMGPRGASMGRGVAGNVIGKGGGGHSGQLERKAAISPARARQGRHGVRAWNLVLLPPASTLAPVEELDAAGIHPKKLWAPPPRRLVRPPWTAAQCTWSRISQRERRFSSSGGGSSSSSNSNNERRRRSRGGLDWRAYLAGWALEEPGLCPQLRSRLAVADGLEERAGGASKQTQGRARV
jgi:hypothetical protein